MAIAKTVLRSRNGAIRIVHLTGLYREPAAGAHGYRTRRWSVGKPAVLIPACYSADHRHPAEQGVGE